MLEFFRATIWGDQLPPFSGEGAVSCNRPVSSGCGGSSAAVWPRRLWWGCWFWRDAAVIKKKKKKTLPIPSKRPPVHNPAAGEEALLLPLALRQLLGEPLVLRALQVECLEPPAECLVLQEDRQEFPKELRGCREGCPECQAGRQRPSRSNCLRTWTTGSPKTFVRLASSIIPSLPKRCSSELLRRPIVPSMPSCGWNCWQ